MINIFRGTPAFRYAFGVVLLATLQCVQANDSAAVVNDICTKIRPDAEHHIIVKRSGCYQLVEPIKVGYAYVFSEGIKRLDGHGYMIQTEALDTEIDLAGLKLTSTAGSAGVVARGSRGNGSTLRMFGEDEFHRFVLRNGTIDLSDTDDGVTGTGVTVPEEADAVHSATSRRPIPTRFSKVEYLLENLTIKAGDLAALLLGDGIVVRNCTIEVEGENALVIYGPNAVVENNRIEFRFVAVPPGRVKPYKSEEELPTMRAAIYLRNADHAVVRGNTISVSGRDGPVSAVAVVHSKQVLVEGNRFNSDEAPVVLRGASSAKLRGNQVKTGIFGSMRAVPDQELE